MNVAAMRLLFTVMLLLVSMTSVAQSQTDAAVATAPADVMDHTTATPKHGFPEILTVKWETTPQVHPGSLVAATVTTSDNVGYVEGRVKYWQVAFTQVAPGKFHLSYRVPLLPPNALGRWDVQIVARSVDGVGVRRTFQFQYKYF